MLTRNDVTLSDARAIYASIAGTGVRPHRLQGRRAAAGRAQGLHGRDPRQRPHVLPRGRVRDRGGHAPLRRRGRRDRPRLPDRRHASSSRSRRSSRARRSSSSRTSGEIVGHPCLLRGSIERICDDARKAEAAGVDGINLLAYRYDGDVSALVGAVSEATTLPLICAGSVDSVARIEELRDLGVWAFTIGTAALDGVHRRGRAARRAAPRHARRRRLARRAGERRLPRRRDASDGCGT